MTRRDVDQSVSLESLERDLDAMGRVLASREAPAMPGAVANAARSGARIRVVRRWGGGLAAAACVGLVGLAVLNAAMREGRQPRGGRLTDSPVAALPTGRSWAQPSIMQSSSSVAALRMATQGLEGAALLSALPSPSAGGGATAIEAPRLGERLDSPRARAVLGRD
jgi:hypothetical protein